MSENDSTLKEVSCRVTNSVLKYLESQGYDADSILSGLSYSKEYLSDPLNWVTYETRETLCRRAAELTKDDAIMIKVGLSAPILNPLGGIEAFIRHLTGPKTVYRFLPKYAPLFDRLFKFKTTITGNNTAAIIMSGAEPGNVPSKDSCYFTQGILAAIPTLWNLPPADIHEKKCMCPPTPSTAKAGVQYEAETCEYDVKWQALPSRYQRFRDNYLAQILPLKKNFKELEQSFQHMDRKNAELIARNRQLAAVREIAIGVDKVRTIDEALTLTVEQSREIAGVRLVLVQKLDETGEFVITPYYSKTRPESRKMVDAIKALGFDPEKEMGKNPTSNKLRFRFSKLKVAQEYTRNPRVMVMTSLAELLDGIWPKTLCDAIQKILGINKFVIVPLIVEGKSWGNMLYFLTQEVPVDILEMIGGHCALAIKNIMTLHNLERRSEEAERAKADLEELIKKQKSTEDKLRESEERYRTIFQSANDILVLLDNKGKIVDVNARIEDIGGYAFEEVIGKDFRLLSKILTRRSMAVIARNYLKRIAGMNTPFYDVEMMTKNGEHRQIQINAVAVRKEGKIIGDLGILRDVTGMKQAEKNLKLQKALTDRVLATIPNAVLLLDNELNVIMANQAFYNLFQLKRNRAGKKYIKETILVPYLDRAIMETMTGKEKKTNTEFRYPINSTEKILETSIFVMKEENILVVINDVTEEREKQERLYLTDRLASVGEMASGVAHELNNPLTSIIGLTGLLKEQGAPDDILDDLNAIDSEAQRCAAIVKNLLTFARKHVSTKKPVQVTKILEEVLKLRAYEHKVNNIHVETGFAPALPEVMADYFEMQQVFLNIILNAEAAMTDAHGHGTLKITGESVDSHISISFADDGPGITRENLGLIFNPFFTTKEVGKGTGLGLSICYGIVTSHGGKVYARSERGKGATFVVELPILSREKGLTNDTNSKL